MKSNNEEELSFATNKKHTVKFKIVFIGDQSVGKSSIINRFIKDEFDPSNTPTIGIDFVSKNIIVKSRSVRLQLWDTAGQQRFKSLIPGYLRDSHAIFIVYDITNKESYNNLNGWIDYSKQHRGQDVPIFIIGNKKDQEDRRAIDSDQAKQKCEDIGAFFIQVSAKTGYQLQQLFNQACEQLMKSPVLETSTSNADFIRKKSTPTKTHIGQQELPIKKSSKTNIPITTDTQIKGTKLVNKPKSTFHKQKNCC